MPFSTIFKSPPPPATTTMTTSTSQPTCVASATAATAATGPTTTTTTTTPTPTAATYSQPPMLMAQDSELLGNERFIRRLFVPADKRAKTTSNEQPEASQPRLTIQTASSTSRETSRSSSRRSSLEVQLNVVGMDPAGSDEPQASQLRRDLGLVEGFQMVELERGGAAGHDDNSALPKRSRSSYAESHHEHQMPPPQHEDSCEFTFEKLFQKSFLGTNQSFMIAKKKSNKTSLSREEIAIRIRTGASGRAEWLNELQVYLIPNFRHPNILDYLGSEQSKPGSSTNNSSSSSSNDNISSDAGRKKSSSATASRLIREQLPRISDIRKRDYLWDSCEEEEDSRREDVDGGVRIRLQYWLLNRFDNCIVLRDYLREQVLDWSHMIGIARGIMEGLHYLHENGDYQGIDKEQAVMGFIKSTGGALKRVAFIDKSSKIMMWPQYTCSIIHRNLSSMNIVLRGPDLRPCIWNFSHSKIHHPFQPTNHVNLIDKRLKDIFLSSPYSPPEVLQERAYLTLTALKSIDMYACGVLYWELLSRCRLPKLDRVLDEHESLERCEPDRYYEPFEREFGPQPSPAMLCYAVCRLHARPELKKSWLLGRKSYSFTQTIQDLWDQDFDARVHTSTVMDRLERIDLAGEEDSRHDFAPRNSKSFDHQSQWPPRSDSIQVPPFLDKCEPNLVLLD